MIGVLLAFLLTKSTLGAAFLASQNDRFPCDLAIKFHRSVSYEVFHSTLWATFGNNKTCLKKIFHMRRPVTMEIYLSDECCRRRAIRPCDSRELLPFLNVRAYNEKIEAGESEIRNAWLLRARKIKSFCDSVKKKGDRCLLALGLESNFSKGAAVKLIKWAKRAGWREGNLVYNPTAGFMGVPGRRIMYERHGSMLADFPVPRQRAIASLDGEDSDLCTGRYSDFSLSLGELSEYLRYYGPRANYTAAWCPNWQGRSMRPAVSGINRTPELIWSELLGFIFLWGRR